MQLANADVKSAQIEAVIIRADGTKVDLGAVAYYHKNPIKRLAYWIKNKIKRS